MKRLGIAKSMALFLSTTMLLGWATDYFKGRPLRGLVDFAPVFIAVIIVVMFARDFASSKSEETSAKGKE